MLRWIVGSSLKFRYLVVALAAALMFFGVQQLGDTDGRRLPRVRAAEGRDPDARPRPLREPGRGPGHDPARADAQRRPGARRDPLEVGGAAVVDRDDLRAGDRSADGTAARRRAHRAGVTPAADLGEPSLHDPAALGDEPGHEDRPHVDGSRPRPDRPVDDRPTGRSGRGCCACRAWRTSPSGASGSRCPRPGRSGTSPQARRHARRRHGRPRPTPSTPGCSTYTEGNYIGTRRLHRHRRPAAIRSSTSCRSSTPEDLAGVPVEAPRRHDAPGRRRGRPRRGHVAAGRRRRHQRRPGPDAHRREVPLGQHARGDAGRRGSPRGARARPPGHRDRHHDLPAGDLHRGVDQQPHEGDLVRRDPDGPDALHVPVRVADGVDQRGRDPAVADRGRPRPPLARGHDQHDDPGRHGDRRSASSSTTRSSTSRTSSGASDSSDARAAARRPPGSSSKPRSRCGARSSTPR